MKPILKLVPEQPHSPSYKDWLKHNRRSLEWRIERTTKGPGDKEIINPALERWRAR